MSGLQQAPHFSFDAAISLESIQFSARAHIGTVVANSLLCKAMVAGFILETEEQGP
jgi:hypothetical protein